LDANVEPVEGELKREGTKEVAKPEEEPEKREESQGGTGFVLEW